ncbi:MAG: hypothetical protein JWP06_71 [Candidatus Saccharibacteria bacterium]|nr:hypothetical protein [Candidatus Saccharibacteria bacterium]
MIKLTLTCTRDKWADLDGTQATFEKYRYYVLGRSSY